ncbi:MAG: hypothetical protein M3303_01725 [Gemmatimonadota bacterium]|nr:hypothetical protein [Gemmatimonadota bacterium]
MTESPWVSIAIVWLAALILGGVLWQRFTRAPVLPGGLVSRTPTRRVVPLWLALALLILLVTAVWLTVRWGAPLWNGAS